MYQPASTGLNTWSFREGNGLHEAMIHLRPLGGSCNGVAQPPKFIFKKSKMDVKEDILSGEVNVRKQMETTLQICSSACFDAPRGGVKLWYPVPMISTTLRFHTIPVPWRIAMVYRPLNGGFVTQTPTCRSRWNGFSCRLGRLHHWIVKWFVPSWSWKPILAGSVITLKC